MTIFNSKTKEEETLELDAVIPLLGFHSDLGAIKEWGLDTEKADIKVNQLMETNVPGIYAAGDITAYPGKLKLIATGAAEACIAVNNAVHYINPKAKVNPGHSSNLAIFGQNGGLRDRPPTSCLADRPPSHHLRPQEEPQLPRARGRPLQVDPHHAALRDSRSAGPPSRRSSRSAASSSIQGEWPTSATIASAAGLADVVGQAGRGPARRPALRRAPAG